MKKEITIKAPKQFDDLRIRHFKTVSDPLFKEQIKDLDKIDVKTIARFVADITDSDYMEILRVDVYDLLEIFNHCVSLFADYDPNEKHKEEIMIEGRKYVLVNPHKVAAGWHIDWSETDKENDLLQVAALMYLPKECETYGEKDQNENIVYPLAERKEIFEKHFKLSDFIAVNAFFLTKYMR